MTRRANTQKEKRNLEKARHALQQALSKKGFGERVHLSIDAHSIVLSGDVATMEERLLAGYTAARFGFKGVVNDLTIGGAAEAPMKLPSLRDSALEGKHYNAVIIGAGVIGAAIARELSRYDLSIAVFEKEADVAMQASGHNDGMVHPGFADNPKKKKGTYNTRGNRLFTQASKELKFDLNRCGSFLLFNTRFLRFLVPVMRRRCKLNGVDGDYGYKSRAEVQRMDPYLKPVHHGGFWQPSAGVASPLMVTVAYAENAAQNGVEFFFDTAVCGMTVDDKTISALHTNRGTCSADVVINAAGVWADVVAGFAGDRFFSIHGRKGTDAILDKKLAGFQKTSVGMPNLLKLGKSHSKGGGIMPCVEGNILIGPNAEEVFDREDYSTSAAALAEIKKHLALNSAVSAADIITYYSGVRACTWEEDFIVEASERVSNLVHAAGIQSPGFASAPAIAEDIVQIALGIMQTLRPVGLRKNFDPERHPRPDMKKLSDEQKRELIARDPAYGKILCRCEEVSEGEIRDCAQSPVPARSVDAVKRRVRAGAGRCHGGFCMPRVMEIIARTQGIPYESVTKKGGASAIVQKLGEEL